ncbi:glycosyltransferase [Nonomuraea sp. NPDC003709]|uniref:glycosyltransferase n=1 Tax=Nonomuraea sp. NPDC003709 TaxID=3154450 RepID=UPI0033A78E95
MTRIVHSLAPTNHTGGRVYLRMLQQLTSEEITWRTVPDFKRADQTRRWRTMRHVAAIAPHIRTLHEAPGAFVWDDLSLLLFTPAMRARTIFILHHYEPLQHDSAPIQAQLWQQLFSVLPQCAAVVCVAPYWARFLQARGVDRVHVIYNSFDLPEIDHVRSLDKDECRAEHDLPRDGLLVYAGKAVHGKGIHLITTATARDRRLHVITTGSNTIGHVGAHFDLPRRQYLRLLRACDVGVFVPEIAEGWSRCAAEAILVGLPCLLQPIAGLGDLAELTGQPAPDLHGLAQQLHERAAVPPEDMKLAYDALAHYDLNYFQREWSTLLATVS